MTLLCKGLNTFFPLSQTQMVMRGRMDAPQWAVEWKPFESTKTNKAACLSPPGKGLAIYWVKMINIPPASSEVTKPHSKSLWYLHSWSQLDVNLSQQKRQWIIVLGFRASAEMLLIFKFLVILELTSKRCYQCAVFSLFLCSIFFTPCYVFIHYYFCSETQKSSPFFS